MTFLAISPKVSRLRSKTDSGNCSTNRPPKGRIKCTGCLFKKFPALVKYQKTLRISKKIIKPKLLQSNLSHPLKLMVIYLKISSEKFKLHWNLIKCISLKLFVTGSEKLYQQTPCISESFEEVTKRPKKDLGWNSIKVYR